MALFPPLKKTSRLLAAALLALAAVASQAHAVPITGIADENLPGWSAPSWSAFETTGVKQVRHTTPWNVADGAHNGDLATTRSWIEAAEARGLEVLISFRVNWGENVPPPSLAKYSDAVHKFRQQFPQVKYFTAWNEPNHRYSSIPDANTNNDPVRAAEYAVVLDAICHSTHFPTNCTVIAGDFLDPNPNNPNAINGFTAYVTAYKQRLAQAGVSPSAWAIHPYAAAELGNWTGITNAFKPLTENKPIWFTEVGGMVCKNGSGYTVPGNLPGSLAFANSAAANLAGFSDPRVARTYYYFLSQPNDGEVVCDGTDSFDSALLGEQSIARPAFKTVFPNVPGPAAQTTAATNVGKTGATLNGVVDANGLHTAYKFEYGTTTNYGDSIPLPQGYAGFSHNGVPQSANLGNLKPGTTYHYRIVASNEIGAGQGSDQVFKTKSAGFDFTGDGHPDLLARTPAGALWLYRGNGQGSFQNGGEGQQIGGSWQVFNAMISLGDFTGDGPPDVLTRTPAGALWLFRGNGQGSFQNGGQGQLLGGGWQVFNAMISPGDFSGDGNPDIIARTHAGALWLYRGDGQGGFQNGGQGVELGGGWQVFNAILDAQPAIGTDTPGVFAPGAGNWCLSNRTASGTAVCDLFHTGFGTSAPDEPVGGDWNGDGIGTPGVFNPSAGAWCLSNRTASGTPSCDVGISLGSPGDQPLVGDWNGDGIDTIGVFNSNQGAWCLSNRTTPGTAVCDLFLTLGPGGPKPIVGDWNGDGIDTIGIFDHSIGHWCLSNRTTSGTATCDLYHTGFGTSSDRPTAGDWNGDGIDSPGLYNGTNQWCLSNRSTPGIPVCDLNESLGSAGAKAVVGDWDGN